MWDADINTLTYLLTSSDAPKQNDDESASRSVSEQTGLSGMDILRWWLRFQHSFTTNIMISVLMYKCITACTFVAAIQ